MIRIVEVGPRDGLQNEPLPISTAHKLQFIKDLEAAGLREIEVSSFVSPKWVPQLGDATELFRDLGEQSAKFYALVPNLKGLERAIEAGVKHIALFTAASSEFTRANINMSVDESLVQFKAVSDEFRSRVPEGTVRGYVSTAFDCPYSGRVNSSEVVRVVTNLTEEIGVDEISLGDTIGVAVPKDVETLHRALAGSTDVSRIAWHFHDTRGTALANVAKSLELGYTIFDASAGGLGGCPYAKGAGGNLATEDLVYFLERTGVSSGVDLKRLAQASLPIFAALGRAPTAKAQVAVLAG